jgi:uncharacterized protein
MSRKTGRPDKTMTFAQCTWLNEPAVWRSDGGALTVTTDGSTDFWRETHYGFTRDTGHFFGCETAGDFTAEMRIQAQYKELYDQAGLMVRFSDDAWIKAGIELSDGKPMASSVLTLGKSDWATSEYHGDATDFRMRVTVKAGSCGFSYRATGSFGRSCGSARSRSPRAIAWARCVARRRGPD